jgi:Ran GTPase-activating protein (RanGAP) involved in mRNA processing and transport
MLDINSNSGHIKMTRRSVKSLRILRKELYGNTSITKIEIKNNDLNYRDTGKLIEKLFSDNFRGAVEVDLSNNGFNSKLVGKIITLMSMCKHLKVLDLSGNFFNRKDERRLRKASRKYSELTLFFGPSPLTRS